MLTDSMRKGGEAFNKSVNGIAKVVQTKKVKLKRQAGRDGGKCNEEDKASKRNEVTTKAQDVKRKERSRTRARGYKENGDKAGNQLAE